MILNIKFQKDKNLENCISEIYNLDTGSSNLNPKKKCICDILKKNMIELPFSFKRYVENQDCYNFIIEDNDEKKLMVISELKINIIYHCETEYIKSYIYNRYKEIVIDIIFPLLKDLDYILYIDKSIEFMKLYNIVEMKNIFLYNLELCKWKRSLIKWNRKNSLNIDKEKYCEWDIPEFNNKLSINFTDIIKNNEIIKEEEYCEIENVTKDEFVENEDNSGKYILCEKKEDEIKEKEKNEDLKEIENRNEDKIMTEESLSKVENFIYDTTKCVMERVSDFLIKYLVLLFIFIFYSKVIF
jgi:hypothetical protein